MRIAVFGVGGVGGYFGGRLAKAGQDVIFIARGEALRALKKRGLHVDSPDGDFLVNPVSAAENPTEVGQVDAVILGVKAWQVSEAAELLRPLMGPDSCVMPLQNGVEASDQLADVLGRNHVLGGLCYVVSFIVGPGHIKHAGMVPRLIFGELDGKRTPRAERLLKAFSDAGIGAEISTDIHTAIWEKFLFIASLSGVGAVARVPVGIARALPETRRLYELCASEIATVAAARGIRLEEDPVRATMVKIDNLPPEATASMQRDIMAGLPSELSAQNGAVVRLGRKAGIPTPVNEFFCASLLPQEQLARGQVSL
ncbi:MAG: 2-dehydropantoate 2-reductase [Desulfomonile tiedjei]|uniref:2-dehydropantoate 2-reductase n=1 Tax=Desulfomonile tiedjei TaxID=2358 RepID=A0A9D6Z6D6_9BACT|nr:2-dehydropantoate 2-reductase [Desulfomonile tiedjei]